MKGISFKRGDLFLQEGREFPYALIKTQLANDGPAWDLLSRRDGTNVTAKQIPQQRKEIHALLQYLDKNIIEPVLGVPFDIRFDLPVIAYYGVNHALLDMPKRRRNFRKNYTRLTAFVDSLNAVSLFRSALTWIYNKEDEERRLQQERQSFKARLPALEAVRRYVHSLLPGASNLHTATNPLRFLVTHYGQDFELEQLSDGYKTMIGLAMDLSARMAAANPHMDNPLTTEVIVLIDEVDLHRHPTWQRRVISDLLRTFPNMQFVLTSHSPILVEGVNNL